MFWNRRRRRPRAAQPRPPRPAPQPVTAGANALDDTPAAPIPAAITAIDIEHETRPLCECGQPAAFIALIHELHACEPTADGECEDLTPDGADVNMVCRPCLAILTQAITDDIKTRQSRLPKGTRLACKTCGRPIAELHDMLETEAL